MNISEYYENQTIFEETTGKSTGKNMEELLVLGENKILAKRLIELLPADQREVVILRMYAELSFKEIAKHTKCSINTALGRMRYARINLKKLIA